LQNAHGLIEFKGNLPNDANAALVILMGAMRKIES
jgi:hypothetical protein